MALWNGVIKLWLNPIILVIFGHQSTTICYAHRLWINKIDKAQWECLGPHLRTLLWHSTRTPEIGILWRIESSSTCLIAGLGQLEHPHQLGLSTRTAYMWPLQMAWVSSQHGILKLAGLPSWQSKALWAACPYNRAAWPLCLSLGSYIVSISPSSPDSTGGYIPYLSMRDCLYLMAMFSNDCTHCYLI